MITTRTISVSSVRQSDIPELVRLVKKIITNTRIYSTIARKNEILNNNQTSFRAHLHHKNYIQLVARHKRKIVGFCFGSIYGGVMWIEWIGVDKEFRRLNIASLLLDKLEKTLQRKKVHVIWCDTRANNTASIAMFKRHHYVKIGTLRRHWYGHDYYLWVKHL